MLRRIVIVSRRFGDKQKLVGVAQTVFKNGGSWSYFICPRCGGRKKKLWLIDDAPRCLSCCWSLGVRYRSAYGFGQSERLRERDRYVDRAQDRRLRGRKAMMPCRSSSLIAPEALKRDTPTLTSSSKKRRLSASIARFGMILRLRLARHLCGIAIPHTSANR